MEIPLSPPEGSTNLKGVSKGFLSLSADLKSESKRKGSSRLSSLRMMDLSGEIRDIHGRVRNRVSRNRGSDSAVAWPSMPDVPRSIRLDINHILERGEGSLASPVVLLIFVDNHWKMFSNSKACRILRWLPKSSMTTGVNHRPWFNILACRNSRVLCGDLQTLMVSLERARPKGFELQGFTKELSDRDHVAHASIRDEIERNHTRLVAGSNLISFCLRFDKDSLPNAWEAVWRGDDDPKKVIETTISKAHSVVYGTADEYASGAESREQMLFLARTVDAGRIPIPSVADTSNELIEKSISKLRSRPPSHQVDDREILGYLIERARTLPTSSRRIGNVPMKSGASPEVGRHDGGFSKGVKLMASMRMEQTNPNRMPIALGNSSCPIAAKIDVSLLRGLTDLTLHHAFEYVEDKLRETIERGWAVGVVTMVRPESTGGKPRIYVAGQCYTAFAQRISRGALARINDEDPSIKLIRKGISPGTMRPVLNSTKDARYIISPDASGATDTMRHEHMRAVYNTAIDRVTLECLQPWLQNFGLDRVKEFMKMSVEVYSMETRMVNSGLFTRKKYRQVYKTDEDFSYSKGSFDEPIPQKPFPSLTGRVLGGISQDTCVVGETSSGKSFGAATDLIDGAVLSDMIMPRRVAAISLYHELREKYSNRPDLDSLVGIKIFGLEENLEATVVIGSAGAMLGRLRKFRLLVIDESHEVSDELDALRAKAKENGCCIIEMSATPPSILKHLPIKRVSRFDGRVRVIDEFECGSMKECISSAMAYAATRGGRAMTITPAIGDVEKTSAKIGGYAIHGKTAPEDQEVIVRDTSTKPVCGSEILTSSVTIENTVVVVREGYTWGSCYDPVRNISYLGRFQADKATIEQSKGRAARKAALDEPLGSVIRGRFYLYRPKKTPPLVGDKGDCIPRPGYCDLSSAAKGCYRKVHPLYLAAAMHDAPLTSNRERRVGGPPGVRNLLSKLTPENGNSILAECSLRLENTYSEAAREKQLGNPTSEEDAELDKLMKFQYDAMVDPITTLGQKCSKRFETIWNKIGCPELTEGFRDITNLVAESFPGEVAIIEKNSARWASRSYSWIVENVDDGPHLCQLNVRMSTLDCMLRPITSATFSTREKGVVYEVGGDEEAPVVSIANGKDATECDTRLIEGRRAILDPEKTLRLQTDTFVENERNLIDLGSFARSKHHGSDQSALNSFEFLNFTTSASMTYEAMEISHRAFVSNPEPFFEMGVPRTAIPPPTRQRGIGYGFGDDRHLCSNYRGESREGVPRHECPDESLNVLLAMVHTADAMVSPKTGRQDTSVPFTLSTFCAQAIEAGVQSHVVSDARRFLKSFGCDGPGPSMGPAPHWYLASRCWHVEDPGSLEDRKFLLRTHGRHSDLVRASDLACMQIPYSTMVAAGRLCRYENIDFEEAISLCLCLFPMPAHNPTYRTFEDSKRVLDGINEELASLNRDESFVEIYETTDFQEEE